MKLGYIIFQTLICFVITGVIWTQIFVVKELQKVYQQYEASMEMTAIQDDKLDRLAKEAMAQRYVQDILTEEISK